MPQVDVIIKELTVSSSSQAKSSKPIKGCNSCNCPTPAIPPSASPRYQKKNPNNMLKKETYTKPSQAFVDTFARLVGHKITHSTSLKI